MSRNLFLPALFAALAVCASPTFAQTDAVRIDEPRIEGTLLDWCKEYADKCGQPAADAYCRASGYRRSVRFVQLVNPGKPTRIISTGEICDNPECDSFRWIECKPKS